MEAALSGCPSMSDIDPDSTKKRLALQPARAYELPGGPYAKFLGSVDVRILSEFKRGSDEDRGVGSSR